MRYALITALIGILATAIGFTVAPRQTLFSYLTSAAYVISIALGALLLLMIFHTADARWPIVTRRLNEALAGTLPLFAILFIPILLGLHSLYSWTAPERYFTDERALYLVRHKAPYLNPVFFTLRTVFYFLVWAVVALLLRGWSLRQDATGDPQAHARLYRLSAFGIPAVGITLTFASFDWLMSLTPTWYSTMFGIYYFAGGFVAAIALLIIVTRLADRSGVIQGITGYHYHALGRLLHAFVIFYAYIAFFQYMLIWIADRPIESAWYIPRSHGSWGGVSVFLILAHFFAPFLALLPYRPKHNGTYLSGVSTLILIVHYVDLHWIVMPALHPDGWAPHWTDLAALLALGGLGVAGGLWLLRGHALVPRSDPRLAESLRYRSP